MKLIASPPVVRLGGLALLIGSWVFDISVVISFFVPGPLGPSGPPVVWDAWIGATGGLTLLIGLPAVYTVQSKRAGMIGLLGLIGLFVAGLPAACHPKIYSARCCVRPVARPRTYTL